MNFFGHQHAFADNVHLCTCAFLGLSHLGYLLARQVVPNLDYVTSRFVGPDAEHKCILQCLFFHSLSIATIVD